ncbi:MAG: PHP domain-containing protein [Bacteroidota bacterium]
MLLNIHSYYSLRYGTLSIDQIVETLIAAKFERAVLTDINNSTGVLEFIKKCSEKGIQGLAGMEFRNGDEFLYFGIARNQLGFQELNILMTECNRDKRKLPAIAPAFNNAFVVYPFGKKKISQLRPNEFIGVKIEQLNRIVLEPRKNYERYVIWKPVTIKNSDENHKLHKQLRSIGRNILISQLKEKQVANRNETFVTKVVLLKAYKDFPEIIASTEKLLSQCSFDFNFKEIKNKQTFTGNRYDDKLLLEKYAMDGLQRRYGNKNKVARERVQEELSIIDNLNFSSYFLITDDICRYARSREFRYVGRGSGANSVVAYCLGITDVCPN